MRRRKHRENWLKNGMEKGVWAEACASRERRWCNLTTIHIKLLRRPNCPESQRGSIGIHKAEYTQAHTHAYPFEYHTVFKFKSDKSHFTVWRSSIFSGLCLCFLLQCEACFCHEDETQPDTMAPRNETEREVVRFILHEYPNVCLQYTLKEKKAKNKRKENERSIYSVVDFDCSFAFAKWKCNAFMLLQIHLHAHTYTQIYIRVLLCAIVYIEQW